MPTFPLLVPLLPASLRGTCAVSPGGGLAPSCCVAWQEHPSATEPRSSASEKPKEKGRAVQLVVKINEFRYRLALFRSSCVTTAIVSGTLDSYISSTPLYNKTLFDLRNKIRLLGFAHPASYICKIILLPARRVHLSCSRCAADVEGTCPCLHFSCQMEICGGAAELLLLQAWVSFFFFNSSSKAGGSGAGAEAPRVPAQPWRGGRCVWLSSPECRWEISGHTLLAGFIPLCLICPGEEVPYNKSALPVE